MKFRPILFSTEMVQARLQGRKTQTRRTKGLEKLNEYPPSYQMNAFIDGIQHVTDLDTLDDLEIKCPYGKVGDVLWVKETHLWVLLDDAPDLLVGSRDRTQWVYKASIHEDWIQYAKEKYGYKWKPSIYMPKEAARIFLKITNIRVERLQDISEDDAIAEGCIQYEAETDWMTAKYGFELLWESINGLGSWDKNPWVWVVEFEQTEKPTLWPK
jgi:hypothetical protein